MDKPKEGRTPDEQTAGYIDVISRMVVSAEHECDACGEAATRMTVQEGNQLCPDCVELADLHKHV